MAIRRNGLYSDPAFAQAAQNIQSLFAPPSGADASGWAQANLVNQKSSALRSLIGSTTDPDRIATYVGAYDPTNSWTAQAQNDATKRFGYTTGANAEIQKQVLANTQSGINNTADNARATYGLDLNAQTELEKQRLANTQSGVNNTQNAQKDVTVAMLNPVAAGATRFVPPALSSQYAVPQTQVGVINAGQGDTVVDPTGRTVMGVAKPLSVDEVKAAAMRDPATKISDADMRTIIMGDTHLTPVQDGAGGSILLPADQAAGRAPALDKAKAGETDQKLRGEITALPSYKNWAQARPIYQNLLATAGSDTKASDLNIVYSIGKLFDPGSVVREGEQIAVKNTAALPDWLQGAIAQLNGGSALTKETRQALLKEAHVRMKSYDDAFSSDRERYGHIADVNGRPRDQILPDFTPAEEYKPAARPGLPAGQLGQVIQPRTAPAPIAPVRVGTPAEAARLPPGTPFIDPNGIQRVRP